MLTIDLLCLVLIVTTYNMWHQCHITDVTVESWCDIKRVWWRSNMVADSISRLMSQWWQPGNLYIAGSWYWASESRANCCCLRYVAVNRNRWVATEFLFDSSESSDDSDQVVVSVKFLFNPSGQIVVSVKLLCNPSDQIALISRQKSQGWGKRAWNCMK